MRSATYRVPGGAGDLLVVPGLARPGHPRDDHAVGEGMASRGSWVTEHRGALVRREVAAEVAANLVARARRRARPAARPAGAAVVPGEGTGQGDPLRLAARERRGPLAGRVGRGRRVEPAERPWRGRRLAGCHGPAARTQRSRAPTGGGTAGRPGTRCRPTGARAGRSAAGGLVERLRRRAGHVPRRRAAAARRGAGRRLPGAVRPEDAPTSPSADVDRRCRA